MYQETAFCRCFNFLHTQIFLVSTMVSFMPCSNETQLITQELNIESCIMLHNPYTHKKTLCIISHVTRTRKNQRHTHQHCKYHANRIVVWNDLTCNLNYCMVCTKLGSLCLDFSMWEQHLLWATVAGGSVKSLLLLHVHKDQILFYAFLICPKVSGSWCSSFGLDLYNPLKSRGQEFSEIVRLFLYWQTIALMETQTKLKKLIYFSFLFFRILLYFHN